MHYINRIKTIFYFFKDTWTFFFLALVTNHSLCQWKPLIYTDVRRIIVEFTQHLMFQISRYSTLWISCIIKDNNWMPFEYIMKTIMAELTLVSCSMFHVFFLLGRYGILQILRASYIKLYILLWKPVTLIVGHTPVALLKMS